MGCNSSTAVVTPKKEGAASASAPKQSAAADGVTAKRVLVLRNSISGAASFSNKGIDVTKRQILEKFPTGGVTFLERDLVQENIPFLDEELYRAAYKGETSTPAQQAFLKLSGELIAEIKSVDLIIIGLPRYNFSFPSSLKAYIDHIVLPGVTFKFGANGVEGLLPNVPVWFVMSAGGVYGDDHLVDWARTVMNFVGLKQLTFLPVEGVAMSKVEDVTATHDKNVAAAIAAYKQ